MSGGCSETLSSHNSELEIPERIGNAHSQNCSSAGQAQVESGINGWHDGTPLSGPTCETTGELERHSDTQAVNGLQQLCCLWSACLVLLLLLFVIIAVWIIVVLGHHL